MIYFKVYTCNLQFEVYHSHFEVYNDVGMYNIHFEVYIIMFEGNILQFKVLNLHFDVY